MWIWAELGTMLAATLLGLVVGAYIAVLVPRAVRREPLLRPRPRLPRAWGELFRTSVGPMVVTAATFAALALRLGPSPLLPAYLYLGGASTLLAAVDIRTRRLPDAITLPSYVVGVTLLGVGAVFVERGLVRFVYALIGMAALYLLYLALLLIALAVYRHGEAMGFGDVKLAGILGLYLGWSGADVLIAGAFLGYLLGGAYGLVALVARRATRTTLIPFGPFMIAGALLGVLVGEQLASLYLAW